MAEEPRRTWWQFRLASILWLMLCIAVGIGGYRWGYDAGFADQANQRRFIGDGFTNVYYIKDLLPANAPTVTREADRVMRDLRANVLPLTWTEEGGRAEVQFFGANKSIVIFHDHDGHQRIAKYLEKRRNDNKDRLAAAK